MKNYIFLLFAGCMVASVSASASDADVGKIKNSEIVDGSCFELNYAVCEYPEFEAGSFGSQTITLVNSPANEFGILPEFYTGEKVYHYYMKVNHWILYKHLLDKPKHDNAIVAPRDKLSC